MSKKAEVVIIFESHALLVIRDEGLVNSIGKQRQIESSREPGKYMACSPLDAGINAMENLKMSSTSVTYLAPSSDSVTPLVNEVLKNYTVVALAFHRFCNRDEWEGEGEPPDEDAVLKAALRIIDQSRSTLVFLTFNYSHNDLENEIEGLYDVFDKKGRLEEHRKNLDALLDKEREVAQGAINSVKKVFDDVTPFPNLVALMLRVYARTHNIVEVQKGMLVRYRLQPDYLNGSFRVDAPNLVDLALVCDNCENPARETRAVSTNGVEPYTCGVVLEHLGLTNKIYCTFAGRNAEFEPSKDLKVNLDALAGKGCVWCEHPRCMCGLNAPEGVAKGKVAKRKRA